jgi:hypothetical protein
VLETGRRPVIPSGRRSIGRSVEALTGVADSLWWLGEIQGAVGCRERAYAAFRRRHDPDHAALVAMRLRVDYRANFGNFAASAGGWLGQRPGGGVPARSARGWVLLLRRLTARTPRLGETLAGEALELARRFGDLDTAARHFQICFGFALNHCSFGGIP